MKATGTKPLSILMIFDKFKDTLSARGVCEAVSSQLLKAFPDANIRQVPISDGGDGFIECMH